MTELLKVILLGIVEGITEWLPVSSTGHLILLDSIMPLKASDAFLSMFRVVIQLGAILAVVVVFFDRTWPIRSKAERADGQGVFDQDKLILWAKIFVACIPAALVGFFLDDWLDAHLYNPWVVALMLILYGVGFILVERRNEGRKSAIRRAEDIDFKRAGLIGIFQTLALIPGTSRSGATILGGITIGTTRRAATEFTFFLAIPVMLGASGLKVVKYAARNGLGFSGMEWMYLIVGIVVAFVVSLLSVGFMTRFVRKHSFVGFGVYRIILGVIVLLFFLIRR